MRTADARVVGTSRAGKLLQILHLPPQHRHWQSLPWNHRHSSYVLSSDSISLLRTTSNLRTLIQRQALVQSLRLFLPIWPYNSASSISWQAGNHRANMETYSCSCLAATPMYICQSGSLCTRQYLRSKDARFSATHLDPDECSCQPGIRSLESAILSRLVLWLHPESRLQRVRSCCLASTGIGSPVLGSEGSPGQSPSPRTDHFRFCERHLNTLSMLR